ncbi:MAG TPA: hypothetical protein PLK85_04950 [Alphaproteobacteria bacterium]|nr:hypothetical protein [Alphaproteobacteria bacterium]
MICLRIILLALFVLSLPYPSSASEINDSGAAKLKILFTDLIDVQKAKIEAQGGSIETKGNITIEKADTYYAATLPEIAIKDTNGVTIHLGLIAVNATPTDQPDHWKMSAALPTPITYTDKDGKPTMRIDIGKQNMTGVWNTELNGFSKLIASYNDIKIGHADKQSIINLGQINIESNLTKGDENKWSGPTKFNIQNINVSDAQKKTFLKVNTLQIDAKIDGYKPQGQSAAIQKIKENPSEKTNQILSNLINSSGEKLNVSAQLNGINGAIPAVKGKDIAPQNFSLDKAYYMMGFDVLDNGKINNTMAFGYNGFKNTSSQDDLLPTQMDFNLAFNNIPLAEIFTTLGSVIDDSINPNAQKVAALQAMMTLPKVLSDAKTTLKISDTKFGNAQYNVMMNADIKANPLSAVGATGVLNTKIVGLDNILKTLEAKKSTASTQELAKINDAIQRIQALRLISDQDGDTNSYAITLTEDAKILVNGKDASGLITSSKNQ